MVVLLYLASFTNIKNKISNVKSFSQTSTAKSVKSSIGGYDRPITRTIGVIIVCFCLTYPVYLIGSINTLVHNMERCYEMEKKYLLSFFITAWLIFLNLALNSFLYSFLNRPIRQLVRNIVYKNQKSMRSREYVR